MARGRAYGAQITREPRKRKRRPELGTARWRRIRLLVLARDLYRCHWQGPRCTGTATEVDHVVPASHGGAPFDMDNLVASCAACNLARPTDAYSGERGVHKRAAYSVRSSVLSAERTGQDAALRPLSPSTPLQGVPSEPDTTTGGGSESPAGSDDIPVITGDYSLRLHKRGA